MAQEEKTDNINLEIVTGDGSELDISPVGNHLKDLKPKTKSESDKKKIVIPEVKSTKVNNEQSQNED